VREHETEQQAIAREVPGVREHETEQRAIAREEPGVREHETEQRAIAREVPGVREHETVIGHGIGGKYIPIMARLAKARLWSKQ